jgi:hypothetical protein
MFHLASTRFNNATFAENMAYRQTHKINAIYGTMIRMHSKINIGSFLFIIEMNNDTNMIEGISLVKNSLVLDKRHKIYDNDDYNRYIYCSDYWLSRQQIMDIDSNVVETFDKILFKGKTHMKRACGITVLNEKLFITWKLVMTVWKEHIRRIFVQVFAPNKCDNRYNYLRKKLLDENTEDPDVAVVDEPDILDDLGTGIDTLSLLK